MWADITVPYWALILTAFVMVALLIAQTIAHRDIATLEEELDGANKEINDLLRPKHYIWIGRHQAGEQFFRINDIPRSRFHFVSPRRPEMMNGFTADHVVFILGYGWKDADHSAALAIMSDRFRDAERWYIP